MCPEIELVSRVILANSSLVKVEEDPIVSFILAKASTMSLVVTLPPSFRFLRDDASSVPPVAGVSPAPLNIRCTSVMLALMVPVPLAKAVLLSEIN